MCCLTRFTKKTSDLSVVTREDSRLIELATGDDWFRESSGYGYVSVGMVGPIDVKQNGNLMSIRLIMWPRPFTSPMTLVLDFQGQILTLSYLGIGKGDSTYITKAVWVDRKLDPLHVCDLKVWPWTWISRSNFENAICCYTHSDLDPWPPMTLNSDCQAQTFKKLYFSNGRVAWHRTKGLWVWCNVGPVMPTWTLTSTITWQWIFGFSR